MEGECGLGLIVEEDKLVENEMNRMALNRIQVSLWNTHNCDGIKIIKSSMNQH